MALLKSTINPQHYLRVRRNSALILYPETKTPDAISPAYGVLKVGYDVFKSEEERIASDTDPFITGIPGQVDYIDDDIMFPEDITNLSAVDIVLKTCYLSLLNDANFSSEWISDE